jgi:type IV secretory pathway TrbD component
MKPDGWAVETLSMEPAKLIVGERKAVIACVTTSAVLIVFGAMSGSLISAGTGVLFFLASMYCLHRMWKADPLLSVVYERFRRFPSFIPAHAAIGMAYRPLSRLAVALGVRHHAAYRKQPQLRRSIY